MRAWSAALAMATLATGACKADVEGAWEGALGDEPASLRLEQHGSALEGELCTPASCEQVSGDLEERSLELGCQTCDPPLVLELVLDRGAMIGEAYDPYCACDLDDEGCACRVEAAFYRCDGACLP